MRHIARDRIPVGPGNRAGIDQSMIILIGRQQPSCRVRFLLINDLIRRRRIAQDLGLYLQILPLPPDWRPDQQRSRHYRECDCKADDAAMEMCAPMPHRRRSVIEHHFWSTAHRACQRIGGLMKCSLIRPPKGSLAISGRTQLTGALTPPPSPSVSYPHRHPAWRYAAAPPRRSHRTSPGRRSPAR